MLENRYLFRGKCIRTNEWVYGSLLQEMYNCYISKKVDQTREAITQICVYKETIGQFTGLTDKNGVKVFEGDILKGGIYSRYVVEWDSYSCEFNIHAFNVDLFEIIGNIHE